MVYLRGGAREAPVVEQRAARMGPDTRFAGADPPPVLLWVPRFWPAVGGTELHTHALATRLLERFPVEVLTHCDTGAAAHRPLARDVCATADAALADGALAIHRLGLRGAGSALTRHAAERHERSRLARLVFGRAFARHLEPAAAALAERARLVHFVYNGLTDAALLARRVAARRGLPFVLTPNVCDTSGRPTAWNSARFRALYRSAARLIALTPHEADWLAAHGADPERIRTVPYGPLLLPGADARRGREALGVGGAPFVLFLGRVVDVKGYDLLLEACRRVRERVPGTRTVFMGPATPASRAAIAAARGTGVTLVEGTDQRLKCDALAGCDVMCLPSRAESLGVAYVEAAYHAKPVVALDLPVLRDVVEHGRHGLRVVAEPAAVAAAVSDLLLDPARRRAMGARAARDARARYDWAAVCDAVAAVYDEAAREARG